jgi:hypothetical protein
MKIKQPIFITRFSVVALALVSAGILVFAAGNVSANSYGTQITVYDGVGGSADITTPQEDNEAEPGMVQNQSWDLEGFFLDRSSPVAKLTIVGGYNFYTGNEGIKAGDIFIDTNGDAVHSPGTISGFDYNPGYRTVSNSFFKYDYVLHVDWNNGTYRIVKLDGNSLLEDTMYGASYNIASNPWIYLSGDTAITDVLSFNTYQKKSQDNTGFDGWNGDNNHYVATFDLTGVDLGHYALFHNTMECGNDNLIGIAHAPEPATMLLFGAGLTGLGFIGTRRKTKT